MTTQELLARARQARGAMALADTQTKDRALLAMAEELEADTAPILAANALDLEEARGRISEVMLDRLALSPDRIAGMAKGIREVAALPDPVGAVLSRVERPNGLVIEKTAVPMGVIAIIYESRPNVTSDAASLTFQAGSVCVLRGGKESIHSNTAIVDALHQAGVLDSGVTLQSLSFDMAEDKTTELVLLDFNKRFQNQLKTCQTPEEERLLVGSVVNTFLSAYDRQGVQLTVNGKRLYSNFEDFSYRDPVSWYPASVTEPYTARETIDDVKLKVTLTQMYSEAGFLLDQDTETFRYRYDYTTRSEAHV